MNASVSKKLTLAGMLCLAALVGCDRTQLTEFNGGELYSNKSVTADEVKELGNFLVESGFFDGGRKSVEIVRKDGELQMRMVVIDGYESDESYADLCETFAAIISEQVFEGEELVMHLCDDRFQTLRVIEMAAEADAQDGLAADNGDAADAQLADN